MVSAMRWLVGPALALALVVGCTTLRPEDWRQARRDSSGQAPDPAADEAVVQVYAARAVGWRRLLAVHSWIVVKPSRAREYTRYEVIGWGVDRGAPAVRVNRTGPDNYWFGSRPEKLADRRGPDVDALIARIETAVATYPYPTSYRTWPGPNSNTFVAHVARARCPSSGWSCHPPRSARTSCPGARWQPPAPAGRASSFRSSVSPESWPAGRRVSRSMSWA
jgi:hypothetical protein